MYKLEQTNQFRKDVKLAKKRGLNLKILDEVVTLLVAERNLPPKFNPHKLSGSYSGLWECHIKPDWLLIWEQADEIRLITLIRTGSHSDLF
ncbi:type II toxin-antitoxin system YafQ family toxin [Epilithonimonas sp.]|uniref:type II toxin-antitoxin system RelE/ParE family toxin n=1 Tax=Epilithonimonas sp. TaxID=2894511 RepID=UPI0035B2428F